MSIAARVRGRWPMSTMVDRVLRGRSRTRIVETLAGAGECDEAHRGPRCRPRRVRASATAFAVGAIAAAVGLGATPASASSGCDAVNGGSLSHTSTVSDSTFQVVTRAVNLGLTTERFTSGDAIHYSYTISNPNGGVHAYYRPTNAAGGAASSVAFIGTSTNTSTTGDVTTSGSGSVTLPANITDIYLYDTQLNAGTSATISWTVSCTPAGGAASPAVTAISPTGGPVGGGTSVTLTGTGFTGATAVKFGTVAAAGFTVNSATSITATAPAAAAAGVVNVAVTTGAGTSLAASGNQFTYAAPTVTGVSPGTLPAAATGSITITGTNFVPGNTSVSVGGTTATGISCSSATSCTATAPARAAGTYDVVVTTGSVASATSAADQLVYASPPGIAAAFSPASITTAQTSTLTVTLTNGNSGTALSGVALATTTLPAGLTGSGSGTTCSGTLSATSTAFALSGASLAAGASCTVTLTVTATAGAAAYPLTTGAVSASGPTTLTGTTASATLTVSAPALATTQSTPSVTGTVGTALSAVTPVTASGGTTPYSFALSGGTLPSGLAFDTATGQLTGTPGSVLAATTFTVTVTDATSPSAQTSGKTFQLTIAQGTQTISFGVLSNASLSASPLTLSATASSSLGVTFASATTGVCTVAGNSVTLLTVGTCTINADQPGNANIAAAPQVQRSFTVTPANLSVTAGAVSGASVGGSYSQANPASGGTAPYSYTLASGALPPGTTLGSSTGTVTGVPTSVGAFSYAIQATDSQGVPATATGATVSGTIAQGTQTISFGVVSNASLSASPLTLSATASSSLGVTFASATTGVCTVAGNSVTLLTTGTCTINADQPGNANIAAAPQVQRSFTVTPANLSVTPGAVSGASVGGSYSQANPASGGTAPYSYTLASGALPPGTTLGSSTGTVTGVPTSAGAFSYAIQATDSQGVPASATGATVSGTIAQGTQTISFGVLSNASLSASPLTLSATASSSLGVTFTSATTGVCTVAGNSVTLLTVGTCTINADQPGNANIAAAPQVQRSFTVTPANLSVTAGAVSGASVGGSYSQANPATGGAAPYSYTLASGALPPGTTLGSSTGMVTGVPTSAGAFSYAIQATDSQGVPATATGATVSGMIAQGTQTISFAALSNASLSASPLTLSATASSSLGVTFTSATTGVCTVAGSSLTLLTVGTCTINADQPGNANIAAAPQVQRSFTVTPANLSVTAGSVSGASVGGSYSQANPASGGTAPYSYTLTSGALPPGTTLGSSTGTVTGVPTSAGAFSYAIQATDSQGVPATATGATVSGTIAQGTQTISFATLSNASLSASPLTLSATASSSLGVTFASATTGVCTVAGNSVTLLTVGTCTINADQPGNANIAAAPQVQRSFTVTPANLSVTAGAVSGASVGGSYSQANPASGGTAPYSYTLASGALPPGTTLGSTTGTVTGVPTSAGGFSYAIQATDSQGVPATATGATVSGTIAQGTQTISFGVLSNASLSASPLTLSATASSSLGVTFASATTGVCTVAGSSLTLLTVGTCTINADQPGNANIAAAPQVQRSFTVTPANLSVTAGAVSGASVGGSYSQANPASGGTAPYSYTLASGALPLGTTLGSTTGMVTGVPTSAGAFSYAIQATDSQGVPASATGATVSGTIAQGTQTITFAALSNASLSSSPLTLSATASSSLNVTFASATTGVCTVAGNSVTLLTVGTCTINADQPGNANIAAAPQVQRSFTVTVGAPVIADRDGVAIGYDSTGTPIDLASSVSGTFSGLSIASPPTHGTATLSGTVVTYAPTPGYFGPDSFTLTATGPGGTSPTATVRLTVETPAAPIATPVSQTVPVTTTANPQGVEINLSDHVTGLFTTLEILQAPQNGTVLLTASVASSAPPADPATATLKAVATPIIAVYTPRAGYVGADSFQFVAVGPGGRSAPGTVSLTVVGNRPGARAKQAAVGDGQPVVVDLTADATEGPFTGATLVSVSPAGSAATALIEAGPVGNRTYRLSITPNARFGGTIAIAYTLTNAFGTSDPAIVTVTVTARPDPSADPTVRAISDAQAETTRRFAQTQIGNFMRRNEQLHTPSSGRGDPLGFRFSSRDGRRGAFDTRFDDNNLDVLDRFTGGDARSNGAVDRLPAFGERGRGTAGTSRTAIADGVYRPGADGVRSKAAAASGPAGEGPDGRSVGGLALWTGGAIEIGTRDATTRRDKITASTQGLSGGVDLRIGNAATVGIGGGYGADLSEINGTAGRVRSDTSAIAAYGSASPIRGVFVDGVFGHGGLDFSTRRLVGNALATGKRDGSMWFGAVSAGIDRDTEALLWSVYGTVQWLDATLGRYVESGAGRLDLRFEARQVTSLSSVLGGRIGIVRDLPFGSVAPQVRGEWQHEFNGSSVQRLDYADIPEPSQYGVSTIGWRRDVFTLSFGSRWVLPGDWGLDLDLGLRGAAGQTSGQLRGQVSKKF